jgi:hypothetical protein
MAEKWIQKSIKHPGALTAQAKRAGATVGPVRQQPAQGYHGDH